MPRSVSRPPAQVQPAQKKLTIAQSPAFKSTHRPRAVHREPAAKDEENVEPAAASTGPRGLTEPKPFNLSTGVRGSVKQASLQRRAEAEMQALKAQADGFKARSMPDFAQIGFLPSESDKELTEFKEFKLAGSAHHAKAVAQFETKVKAELAEKRRKSEIRARPLPESTYKAFEVQHPERSPLKATNPNLKSSTRAEVSGRWGSIGCAPGRRRRHVGQPSLTPTLAPRWLRPSPCPSPECPFTLVDLHPAFLTVLPIKDAQELRHGEQGAHGRAGR